MLFKVRDPMVSPLPGAAGDCTADTRCNGWMNQYTDCDAGCSRTARSWRSREGAAVSPDEHGRSGLRARVAPEKPDTDRHCTTPGDRPIWT